MKTLGKGSLALHREVPGYGGGLQAVQDEGRDSKTQGAMKGESTPRGVPSKPTTLSPLFGMRLFDSALLKRDCLIKSVALCGLIERNVCFPMVQFS